MYLNLLCFNQYLLKCIRLVRPPIHSVTILLAKHYLHLILEQCHLTDFPSPTWLFSILSFTKQINFHCCFLLLTLLKVNVFQKWGDLNACIGQCKMNKTGWQPVSRPSEQPFFMLVLLRRTSFLITFYDLYFNQLAHIFYRLQFFVGLWGQLSCTASTPLNCGHSFVLLLKETLYFIEKKIHFTLKKVNHHFWKYK